MIIWFVGMSGSGKTTLGNRLAGHCAGLGLDVLHLDGDALRAVSGNADFSRAGRERNIDAVREHLLLHAGENDVTIVSAITPYEDMRTKNRTALPGYCEIFCRCGLDVLVARDPKGLYKRALAGEIRHFTGIDDPFEEPRRPDLVVDTAGQDSNASFAAVLACITPLLDHAPLAETERSTASGGEEDGDRRHA